MTYAVELQTVEAHGISRIEYRHQPLHETLVEVTLSTSL